MSETFEMFDLFLVHTSVKFKKNKPSVISRSFSINIYIRKKNPKKKFNHISIKSIIFLVSG